MRVLEAVDNPWFPIGTFVIEFKEDEYKILKKYADIIGKSVREVLQDAIIFAIARRLDLILQDQQPQERR
jgi:hypothetical protein